MKLEAKARLQANFLQLGLPKSQQAILNALEYIRCYLMDSANFNQAFLGAQTAIQIIKPLVDAIGYTPLNRPLYRVVTVASAAEAPKPLIPNKVTSFTYASTKAEWRRPADEIGAHHGVMKVYRVDGQVHELVNALWLEKTVAPWVLKTFGARAPNVRKDLDVFTDYQKEVVGFVTGPVKQTVVYSSAR